MSGDEQDCERQLQQQQQTSAELQHLYQSAGIPPPGGPSSWKTLVETFNQSELSDDLDDASVVFQSESLQQQQQPTPFQQLISSFGGTVGGPEGLLEADDDTVVSLEEPVAKIQRTPHGSRDPGEASAGLPGHKAHSRSHSGLYGHHRRTAGLNTPA